MKKINIIIFASALAITTFFSSCDNKSDIPSQPDSALESTAADEITTKAQPKINDAENEFATESDPQAAEKTTEGETSESSQGQSSTASDSEQSVRETDDDQLIAKAQDFFETACRTNWDFHVGCPYNLDYGTIIENSLGWQFYLVTDEEINSLADIEADYCKVFSDSYPNDLSEIFIEQDGRVYALDGERGSNIFYTGSVITAVTNQTDTEIFFTVENSYSADDYTGGGPYTETADFSVVIEEDGSWRAGVFTLPY